MVGQRSRATARIAGVMPRVVVDDGAFSARARSRVIGRIRRAGFSRSIDAPRAAAAHVAHASTGFRSMPLPVALLPRACRAARRAAAAECPAARRPRLPDVALIA